MDVADASSPVPIELYLYLDGLQYMLSMSVFLEARGRR